MNVPQSECVFCERRIMAGKLKALVVIVSVGMLIYLVSSANISVAEDTEIASQEQFANVTVLIEASVVRVELEALEEIAGESDNQTLNSIPLGKILQCIREEEGGEVVSVVKLAVGNGSVAEITTEQNEQEKGKNPENGTGERADRETNVSFRVEALVNDINKIEVKFDFKQVVLENTLSAVSDAEEEQGMVTKFEVSSELVLRTGQSRIVGATKKDVATFLILSVDI